MVLWAWSCTLKNIVKRNETNKSHIVYHFMGNLGKIKMIKQVLFGNHSFLAAASEGVQAL